MRLSLLAAIALGAAAPATAQQPAPPTPAVGGIHGAAPGEARTARGRVMKGGDTLRPFRGAWVVLHRVGTDRAAPLDSMRTDAGGRFAFSYRTSGDPKALYFASSRYAGIAYFTSPFRARDVSGEDAEIVVHDTTIAPVPIRTRARHIVVSAPNAQRERTIYEIFELSNDSTVTRVAKGDSGAVWTSLLFDGARDATVGQADVADATVHFDNGRVRLTAPFAPGLKQLSYSYKVRAADEYAFPLDGPAGVLEVLIEDALGRAEGGGLKAAGPTAVSGRTFARFLAQDVPAGAVIRVSAPGEPAMSSAQGRVLAIVTALGVVLLVGLARIMMRRQRGARNAPTDVASLRAQLTALDEAFAKIESPTPAQRADHWQARAHLDRQISDAVAREQGLS
jgi:hypothetical protein